MSETLPTVVGCDGSLESIDAVKWAAQEVAANGGALLIVTATTQSPVGMGFGVALPQSYFTQIDIAARRTLDLAVAAAHAAVGEAKTISIETEMVNDYAIPALIARSKDARMVVLGARGLSALQRTFIGSVSSALTSHAHCPVAVLHDWPATPAPWPPSPVVLGTDGSAASRGAVDAAFLEASNRNARLVAVHAWSDTNLPDEIFTTGIPWQRGRASAEATLAHALEESIVRYPKVSVEQVVVTDKPARTLLEHSRAAQLLVVGSHGRGGFAGMLLGSTSTTLLHSVQCPLLIVRSA